MATIGPASVERVAELVDVGLDVARINLSHGSPAEHLRSAEAVRAAAAAAERHVALLVDLPGPKLRLGELPDGGLELEAGSTVRLTGPDPSTGGVSLPLADPDVIERLRVGDRVLLADGAAELRVVEEAGPPVVAEVVRGGRVHSRQGCSVPAERMAPAALSESDVGRIPHLLQLEPDFVGQSFVRSADDVRALREHLPPDVRIVAKIETRPAVEGIEGILQVADAIMVARGDLGVELPFERVPLVQKDLVHAALAAGRPSIVATQMLESMVRAPRPTRAEASDVANAILDGADAVMLSGETAIGDWPVESLRAAALICEATDGHAERSPLSLAAPSVALESGPRALAAAAVGMADADADVVALACYTHTGHTARLLSALRPRVPIVAFTPTRACARSLSLRRGVLPVVLPVGDEDALSVNRAIRDALDRSVGAGWLDPGDAVVLIQTSSRGGANAIEIARL